MKRKIATYVARCLVCQQIKAKHQKPNGLWQPLVIPQWKWEHITMDFVVALPRTKGGHDIIWVIVDHLSKSAHFLPIVNGISMEKLVKMYISDIICLHGVPVGIVSDRDPRFTSSWSTYQRMIGTDFRLSTTFHPQMDGQYE